MAGNSSEFWRHDAPVLRSHNLHILHPADDFTDANDIDDPDFVTKQLDNLHKRNHDQLMAKKEKQERELAKQSNMLSGLKYQENN